MNPSLRILQFACFSNTDGKEPRRGDKGKEDILHASSSQSSNYFEIPTKEGHMANNSIHEIPTKDTDASVAHTSTGKSGKMPLLVIIPGISRIPADFYLACYRARLLRSSRSRLLHHRV